jgi:hypothetical protein
MVSGKPSTRMARQMDAFPPLNFYFMFTRNDVWEYVLRGRQEYGFCSRATDVCPTQLVCVRSCSRLWWLRNALLVFQACVLGLPCKVESRFRNRPPLTMNETAYPFYHIE